MSSNNPSAAFRFPLLERKDGRISVQQLGEQQYQQGYAAGVAAAEHEAYQRGLADGQQLATAQCQTELSQQQRAFDARQQQALDLLSQSFRAELARQDEQLAVRLCELVQTLAATVLQTELVLQPGLLQQIIEQQLPELIATDPLQSIQLSQADAPLLAGSRQIGDIALQYVATQPAGQVLFQGAQQLHQLDLTARLSTLMAPVRQQLLGEPRAAENSV